jgi:hypothetical protein
MRDIAHGPRKNAKEKRKESLNVQVDMLNNSKKKKKVTNRRQAPRRAVISNLRKNVSLKENKKKQLEELFLTKVTIFSGIFLSVRNIPTAKHVSSTGTFLFLFSSYLFCFF